MEFCSFTGISTNTLTGVTRGIAPGNATMSHNSGALVECFPNVTHWTDLLDFLQTEHVSNGTHSILEHVNSLQVTGISGASGIKGDMFFVPGSNISIYAISGASGHSYVKWDMLTSDHLPLLSLATYVLAGTNQLRLIVPRGITLKSISAVIKSPSSTATLALDINRNMTTLFTDQNTRLFIGPGGTYASTASISVTSLSRGNIISLDVDTAQ